MKNTKELLILQIYFAIMSQRQIIFCKTSNIFFLPTYSLLGSVFQSYSSQPSLTPDDDIFKHLSLTYANNHAKMSRGKYNKMPIELFITHIFCLKHLKG